MLAKKKKKKSKEPKTSGIEWARNFVVMPYDSTNLRDLATVAANGYASRSGKSIHASIDGDIPKALWKAPVAVLIVDGGTITYANAAACEAWNQTHDVLIGSTTTLPETLAKPFESNYNKKLTDIAIQGATRWKVEKPAIIDGKLIQQPLGTGYAFPSWSLVVDGTICEPGGIRKAPILVPDDLDQAISDQANNVRHLKEVDGLTNKDPAVLAAVTELKRLRALAESAD